MHSEMGERTPWACWGGAKRRTRTGTGLAAGRRAALPGKGPGGSAGKGRRGGKNCRLETQAKKNSGSWRHDKGAGMDQFLAKPALIKGVLALQRSGARKRRGLSRNRLNELMDMSLDRQALQEESQQGEDRHPPLGGGLPGLGCSQARHQLLPTLKSLRLTTKRFIPLLQCEALFSM